MEICSTTNKDLREKLKPISWGAQGQLPTASHYVILLARNKEEMTYNSEYIDKMMKSYTQNTSRCS